MSVKDNNGSGDRVLLLNLVVSMKDSLNDYSFGVSAHKTRELRQRRSVAGFLKVLSQTVQILPKNTSFEEIKENARYLYNESVWYYRTKTSGEMLMENGKFDVRRKADSLVY